MARLFSARVEGMKPVLKALKKLPDRVQRAAVRPAIGKAGTVVAKAARQRTPTGSGLKPDGTPRKHLKKTITKTRVKMHKQSGTLYVVVGPEKNEGFHSHLVHDGTKAHDIVLSKPLVLGATVLPKGFVIHHPGSRANPFLADAVEATRGKVQNKLRTEIVKGIEKQTAKLRSKK